MINNLIPQVNGKIHHKEGSLVFLPKNILIENHCFEEWCTEVFTERTESFNKSDDGEILICKFDDLKEEEYRLSITSEKITIFTANERGVIHALTSLAEISDEDGKVPICEIEDSPKMGYRGLSLDCVRHFWNVSEVKMIINQMSLVKMNVLHWHLTDDQGFRIEIKQFPELTAVSGEYYTQDEIREIVSYAGKRGIEVIPEIELPGHTSGILAAYPQLSCSGRKVTLPKGGGIFKTILCAGKEETFDFLEKILEEAAPLFTAKYFHIGGDEAPKSEWEKCPLCQKRMEEEHISKTDDLQGYFTKRIEKILDRLGKKAICWNESLLADNISPDTTIQYWSVQYEDSMKKFVKNKGKFVYSDMFEIYFDYPYSMTSMEKVYNLVPNINGEPCADEPGFMGMEVCLWCEHIKDSDRLFKLLFPRIFAFAEVSWSEAIDYGEFKERVTQKLIKLQADQIPFTPIEECDPKGAKRREDTFAYMASIGNDMDPSVKDETMSSDSANKTFSENFTKKFLHRRTYHF